MLLIMSFGCKLNPSNAPEAILTGIDGLHVPTAREFSISELEIAQRICNNLKKKRDFFETLYNMAEKFKFNLELKSCEGTTPYHNGVFEAAIANTNSTYLEYSANQENYFKDIVTDQSGAMKYLCDMAFRVGPVKNTIIVGTYTLSYNVLINNGFDRVEISKQVKTDQVNWTLAGIESIDFISQKSQAALKFFGVEKERILKKNCDGKNFSSAKQTWLEATTNF